MLVQVEKRGPVAVLMISNAPVNSLGSAVRVALGHTLDAALADSEIKAIVLTGTGRFFSSGADIREFNTPMARQEPLLRSLIQQLEQASKPTVAAINGLALGGGLELALGCHYRVGTADATLGLPEVKLGLLPGAGGTQRLPRIAGVENALRIIVSGESVNADAARDMGLLDATFDDDLIARACEFALQASKKKSPDHTSFYAPLGPVVDDSVFEKARNEAQRRYRGCVAPQECIACIEKTLTLDLEAGLAFEGERFQALVQGDQSKAQRHLFFAERQAMKLPETNETVADIEYVGVVGAGTMGGGIAMSVANAGIPVTLFDRDQESLDRGMETIRRNYASSVSRNRLTQEQVEQRLALIRPSLSLESLSSANLLIEAVFEDMAVKKQILPDLDRHGKDGVIIASNTSRLDINELADVTRHPDRFLGMHFFSPANVMRLLEVVKGDKTDSRVIASVFKFARRIGKVPVLVGVCDGFVGNRMVSPYTREAHFLLEEGATPAQVDGALRNFGMAMGPIQMADMAGLDISWAARKRQAPTRPKHIRYSKVADRICELGRFGQKTGSGFYKYEEGSRTPLSDPFIHSLIEDCAREAGIERRDITDTEIIERTIYALINEGARILQDGIAARASDIDVIYVAGYGFPVFRGGPMFYADSVGLPKVLATIRQFHDEHGVLWEPAPLLVELVESGRSFADFDARRTHAK